MSLNHEETPREEPGPAVTRLSPSRRSKPAEVKAAASPAPHPASSSSAASSPTRSTPMVEKVELPTKPLDELKRDEIVTELRKLGLSVRQRRVT